MLSEFRIAVLRVLAVKMVELLSLWVYRWLDHGRWHRGLDCCGFRRGSKRLSVSDAPPSWELGFPFSVGLLGLCLCGVGLPLVVWAL